MFCSLSGYFKYPEPLEPYKRYSITLHTRLNNDSCNMQNINNSESTYGTAQFYFIEGCKSQVLLFPLFTVCVLYRETLKQFDFLILCFQSPRQCSHKHHQLQCDAELIGAAVVVHPRRRRQRFPAGLHNPPHGVSPHVDGDRGQ